MLLYVSNKDDNFRSVCMKLSQKPILDLHAHFGVLECIIQGVCVGEIIIWEFLMMTLNEEKIHMVKHLLSLSLSFNSSLIHPLGTELISVVRKHNSHGAFL